jgi:hypothetical protein
MGINLDVEGNNKLKSEITVLKQRQQQARTGEVTFLRNQLQKKSSELEKARQEKMKLQQQQKEALGKANEEKNLAIDIIIVTQNSMYVLNHIYDLYHFLQYLINYMIVFSCKKICTQKYF